ncbi:MAG: PTS glucose transporter subunit IIA [Solobacterium sp.]|nr:PTS glucose transporter subunit IIA [Solobacterium sp.]MBR6157118.1 PTS glucose transporter subunit IIA [Lachnospiraceae bacterium]
MKKDYPALAADILRLVGGAENVSFVMNCATRLRFTLKDMDLPKTEEIKALKGVIDVIIQNGQYQVCIGPDVPDVLKEVKKLGNFSGDADTAPEQKKKGIDRIFEVISGVFTPIVPVLMAAGMVGALLTVLNLTHILPETSPTYYVWNIIKEAGFYFLPFYIAYTASQKLNANPFLSMLLAGVLLHPQLSSFESLGVDQLSWFGIGIRNVSYANAILPVILGVWLLGYVERFFTKFMPQVIRAFAVPMLTMLVVVPIELILIGPMASYVADFLANAVLYMGDHFGFIAVGIIAALTPIMISTGTHSFAFPVILASLASNGFEGLLVPAMLAENLAMAGAAFAAGFKSKDADEKAEANAATLSACMGISEPAMYGVALPKKTPFLGSIIGSGIGGLVAGLFGVRFYTIASASFVGLPATIGENSMKSFIGALITIAVSFAAAFFFTMLLSKKDGNTEETAEEAVKLNGPAKVASPINGRLIALSEVNDKTFASGAMGEGCAVIPSDGVLRAPADGEIIMLFDTKHAVGIKTTDGVEILIHIGMDTVNLNGEHFEAVKKANDKVRKGDVIVKFDIDAIKAAGYDVTTPVIITNTADYASITKADTAEVKAGETILTVE